MLSFLNRFFLVTAIVGIVINGYYPVKAFNTNFEIKSVEFCNGTEGLFKMYGNVTKEGNNYYANVGIIVTLPLDNHIGISIKIESKLNDVYVELFTIRENDFCKAGKMYGGEFWYDLQRAAQLMPGQCPIQAKRYEVHHHLLDFRKISLQTFPFGQLRFTPQLIDHRVPGRNLLCLVIEVENVYN